MADTEDAKAQHSLGESLRQSIECGICLESKELRMLPCQHLTCSDCLQSIIGRLSAGSEPQCSFCRAVLTKKPEQYPVCRLAQHFQRRMPSLSDTLEQDSKHQCQVTAACDRTVDTLCTRCKKLMCQTCGLLLCQDKEVQHDAISIADCAVKSREEIGKWRKFREENISILSEQSTTIISSIREHAQEIIDAPDESVSELAAKTAPVLSKAQADLQRSSTRIAEEKADLDFAQCDVECDSELIRFSEQLQIYDHGHKVKLGDFTSLVSGFKCYDTCWTRNGHLLVAREGALDVLEVTDSAKTIKTIELVDHPFSIVIYKDDIIVGVSESGIRGRMEVLIMNNSYEIVRRWTAAVNPCDFTVADGKLYFSNQSSGNLKVYTLMGNNLPDVLWNGTSAGIASCSPGAIVLADEQYHKVYKMQITNNNLGILWSADVVKPFSMCTEDSGSIWIRSNRNDCITVLSHQGVKLQEIMDVRLTKLGEILGIHLHESFLYVCYDDGMGRFQLSYQRE